MDATNRSVGTKGQTIGKGAGYIIGILGLLLSLIALFVPLSWIVYANVSENLSGLKYLLGNANAESVYFRATMVLLISISIIYIVRTEGIRVLWLITGIVVITAIGSLQCPGSNAVLGTAAILLAISASFLTVSHNTDS